MSYTIAEYKSATQVETQLTTFDSFKDFVDQRLSEIPKGNIHNVSLSESKEVIKPFKEKSTCFIGGVVMGNRAKNNVICRAFGTLDIENRDPNNPILKTVDDILKLITKYFPDIEGAFYTSFSNQEGNPRGRFVFPFAEPVAAADYKSVMAALVNRIPNYKLVIDECSFRVSQLMFYPSLPNPEAAKDFVCKYFEGKPYEPTKKAASTEATNRPSRKQDPKNIDGMVGRFNRVYTVTEAIETFLMNRENGYVYGTKPNYFTYDKGTTVDGLQVLPFTDENGAVIYEDAFAYIYHNTAPGAHNTHNAYDLVRVTLHPRLASVEFSEDPNVTQADKDEARKKSMETFNKELAGNEKLEAEAHKELAEKLQSVGGGVADQEDSKTTEWIQHLELDGAGHVKTSLYNLLECLPYSGIKIRYNILMDYEEIEGLPRNPQNHRLQDFEISWISKHLKDFFGRKFLPGEFSNKQVNDAVSSIAHDNEYNPFIEWLNGLEPWDGEDHIGKIPIEYLGADPTIPFNQYAMTKHLVAAVARAFNPGYKHDQILLFAGTQGIGKSTLIERLLPNSDWYLGDLNKFSGKDAKELIQGKVFIEVAELTAFSKSSKEEFKSFMSLRKDEYRGAYARRRDSHARQGVFFGSTNDAVFLRDHTGERRNWVIGCNVVEPTKDIFGDDIEKDRPQIWAQAVALYRSGYKTTLSKEQIEECTAIQQRYKEDDSWGEAINNFLEIEIPQPDVWDKMNILQRRCFIRGDRDNITFPEECTFALRTDVTLKEIGCECFGRDVDALPDDKETRRIAQVMNTLPNWKKVCSRTRLGDAYNKYRPRSHYVRVEE